MKKNISKNNSGFTLLEMMIAVSLFTIVMLISSNMFLQSIDSQARSISSKDIQESLNFTLTTITNELAGATVTAEKNPAGCSPDDTCVDESEFFCVFDDGKSLTYVNVDGNCVTYSSSMPNSQSSVLDVSHENGNSGFLTPNNITLTSVNFSSLYMADATYPIARVTVSLTGESLARETHPESMTVQTTIAVGQ